MPQVTFEDVGANDMDGIIVHDVEEIETGRTTSAIQRTLDGATVGDSVTEVLEEQTEEEEEEETASVGDVKEQGEGKEMAQEAGAMQPDGETTLDGRAKEDGGAPAAGRAAADGSGAATESTGEPSLSESTDGQAVVDPASASTPAVASVVGCVCL